MGDKLKVIADTIGKWEVWPTGSSLETFHFIGKTGGSQLTFEHDSIKVTIENLKLLDAKAWDADERHYHYPAVDRYRIGHLWYEADVQWSVGKLHGSDHIALGHVQDWHNLLGALTPGTPEFGVISELLLRVDKLAGKLLK